MVCFSDSWEPAFSRIKISFLILENSDRTEQSFVYNLVKLLVSYSWMADLGEPVETIRRMNKVKGTSWKKPPIEISRHGSYDLPPISSSSFLWKPGNDLKMELRSFLGRSFKNTCKIGGFRFNLRHVSSMASMTSHIGRKVFGPEEHPMSAIVKHSGKLLLYSCTMVSCSMGFAFNITFFCWKNKKANINAISTVSTK